MSVSNAATAQSSDEASASKPRTDSLIEIIVTARKRVERLQDVPASITAIGEEQIGSLQATSLSDLNVVTPNARVARDGGIVIRGISSNTRNSGFEAGASIFLDGVYLGRPVTNNQDLIDVERVEVLRGPQGTVFGKNTSAGAINITTRRPGEELEAKTEAEFGNFGHVRVGGYASGPLVSGVLAGKLSVFSSHSDGYQVDLFNGQRNGAEGVLGSRGELRWTPGDWDIALRADAARDTGEPVDAEPSQGFALAFAPKRDQIDSDHPLEYEQKGGGVSVTAERTLASGQTLTSITAWRTSRRRLLGDDDFTPLDIAWHVFEDKARHWTQELRLSSSANERLSYVAGLYYFGQDLDSYRPVTLGALNPPFFRGLFFNLVDVRTSAYAAYANADYHFTPRLTLNAGLRYTYEDKKLDFFQQGIGPYPNYDLNDAFTDADFSPTLSLSYAVNDDLTTYAKVSRGYKSGGWNPDITTTDQIKFDAETVTNYEIGAKSVLADGRLRVNAAAYYMDYTNLQVNQFLGQFAGFAIRNAGSVPIKGVELEVTAAPLQWLNLSAGFGYNDATYRDYDNGRAPSDPGFQDFSGNQVPQSSRYSGFLTVDVHRPIGSAGMLVLRAEQSYQSRVFFEDTNDPVFSAGSYGLLNARIGWERADGAVQVYLYGSNLTDERALIGRRPDSLTLGLLLDTYNPPRTYGVRLGYRL